MWKPATTALWIVLLGGCTGAIGDFGRSSPGSEDGFRSDGDGPVVGLTADPKNNNLSVLLVDRLVGPVPQTVSTALVRRRSNKEYLNRFEDVVGVRANVSLPSDLKNNEGFVFNRGQELAPIDLETVIVAALTLAEQSEDGSCDDCLNRLLDGGAGERLLGRPLEPSLRTALATRPDDEALADFAYNRAVATLGASDSAVFAQEPLASVDERGLAVIDDFAIADRLATWLWSSAPDARLLELARNGQLADPAVRREEALRMLMDPRVERLVDGFFVAWLHVEYLAALTKDETLFPDYDEALAQALETDFRRAIRAWIESGGTLKGLLTDPVVLEDGALGSYSVGPERVGILHHPAWLAANAGSVEASAIHRGLFLQKSLLCNDIPFPDDAALAIEIDKFPDGVDRKGLAALHSGDPACATCHSFFEPLGFTFDDFGPIGQHRELDSRGVPLDTRASLVGVGPTDLEAVANSRELMTELGNSKRVWACFAQKFGEYALRRSLSLDDGWLLRDVTGRFFDSESSFGELVQSIAGHPAFIRRAVSAAEGEACNL